MRRLELLDVESGSAAAVDLLWEAAPKTCAFIWDLLDAPITAVAAHSSLAGRAVIMDVPEDRRVSDTTSLKPENETVTPLPGEIGFAIYPAFAFEDPQRPDEKDGSSPYWMLTIVYGRDCRFFTLLGWEPVTIFAKVADGNEQFFKLCERIRSDGAKPLRLRRLSD